MNTVIFDKRKLMVITRFHRMKNEKYKNIET